MDKSIEGALEHVGWGDVRNVLFTKTRKKLDENEEHNVTLNNKVKRSSGILMSLIDAANNGTII